MMRLHRSAVACLHLSLPSPPCAKPSLARLVWRARWNEVVGSGSNRTLSSSSGGDRSSQSGVCPPAHPRFLSGTAAAAPKVGLNDPHAILRAVADMRYPQAWFETARRMKRKWVVHVGPTNSGKTHQALTNLAGARAGCYCGPLRLLAWEIHEKLTEGKLGGMKVPCNLMTGQEQIIYPEAKHVSSTIEMVDLQTRYQVGVIDEIQMLGSSDRGWAWTRAVLGLAAEEIHLCGEARTVELLERLCQLCNDTMEVKEYERLSPLKVSTSSLGGSFKNVQAGDCVVAFSRKHIHQIKQEIERVTPHRCSVVYGSLPPETRKEQAKVFNSRHDNSGFDVLVASDAVGMGLNLEIKRIVFSAINKYDGEQDRPLHLSEILQIGGRAGRFGTESSVGVVTTLYDEDLPDVRQAFEYEAEFLAKRKGKPEVLEHSMIRPEMGTMEDFASALLSYKRNKVRRDGLPYNISSVPLSEVIEVFQEIHRSDEDLFVLAEDSLDEMKEIAEAIEEVEMPLRDRFTFCICPVDIDSAIQRNALLRMALAYSQERMVEVLQVARVPTRIPQTSLQLKELEDRHMVLELYLWLAHRFKDAFPDTSLAKQCVSQSNGLIQAGLQQLTREEVMQYNEAKKAKKKKKKGRRKESQRRLEFDYNE